MDFGFGFSQICVLFAVMVVGVLWNFDILSALYCPFLSTPCTFCA